VALSWGDGPWVADTSAWARASHPDVAPQWEAAAAVDELIAAAAAARGFAVLHYDHHFDPLCRVLGVESVWVAKPGAID